MLWKQNSLFRLCVRLAVWVKLIQAEMVTPALTKEDRSPVTVADFASQALVGKLLEEAFPTDTLVGEEDSTVLRQPEGEIYLRASHSFCLTPCS